MSPDQNLTWWQKYRFAIAVTVVMAGIAWTETQKVFPEIDSRERERTKITLAMAFLVTAYVGLQVLLQGKPVPKAHKMRHTEWYLIVFFIFAVIMEIILFLLHRRNQKPDLLSFLIWSVALIAVVIVIPYVWYWTLSPPPKDDGTIDEKDT